MTKRSSAGWTVLLAVAVALTTVTTSPASASTTEAPPPSGARLQDGYVPPECVGGLLPWKKGSWARCSSKYAFRASVRCNNGYYYFGPWLNPGNRTSYAYCPSGTIATNWYVDIPE